MELPVSQRLKKELAELQHELSENAEYEAAKSRQEYVRARIGQLQGRISELSLFNLHSIPEDVVAYGSRVTVEDLEDGASQVYEIVFPEEVNAAAGLISLGSPIGKALLNKTVGDEVEVQTPRGKRSYQITDLVTLHHRSSADAS
jgi:transcription elongation factor GreA